MQLAKRYHRWRARRNKHWAEYHREVYRSNKGRSRGFFARDKAHRVLLHRDLMRKHASKYRKHRLAAK